MLDVISNILNLIAICLTVYELFFKKNTTETSQNTQNILIQQINPNYKIYEGLSSNTEDNIQMKNALWKSKRITQGMVMLIYTSLIMNFISYIKEESINSITDITAIIYIALRNTMIYLSGTIIIFCVILIIRGWNRKQSILSNFMSMKYFSFKIIADVMVIVSFSFVNHIFLQKINMNIDNTAYQLNVLCWGILFGTQLLWIQHTISKLCKTIPDTNLYEKKEEQLISFVLVYVVSILLLGLTLYTIFS